MFEAANQAMCMAILKDSPQRQRDFLFDMALLLANQAHAMAKAEVKQEARRKRIGTRSWQRMIRKSTHDLPSNSASIEKNKQEN